jgi:hypothetical protein
VSAYARGLELVALLNLAGITATIDPRSATPPCVLGVPPAMRFDLSCGYTAEWQFFALVPGPANADAFKALVALAEQVADVLPNVTRADFVSYSISPDAPALPAYRIQLEEGI